jgi:hypothetical protein
MRKTRMNLKVLQLLLRHRDVLMKVVEAAKRFPQDGSYLAKWKIVDEIAELVIPILEQELDAPKLMSYEDEDFLTPRTYDAKVLAAGAEYGALGIDWKLLIDVIIPIVISILEAVIGRK